MSPVGTDPGTACPTRSPRAELTPRVPGPSTDAEARRRRATLPELPRAAGGIDGREAREGRRRRRGTRGRRRLLRKLRTRARHGRLTDRRHSTAGGERGHAQDDPVTEDRQPERVRLEHDELVGVDRALIGDLPASSTSFVATSMPDQLGTDLGRDPHDEVVASGARPSGATGVATSATTSLVAGSIALDDVHVRARDPEAPRRFDHDLRPLLDLDLGDHPAPSSDRSA